VDAHFLPIQYVLRDFLRQKNFEGANRALSGWAIEHAEDPVLTTSALRFRAWILHTQFGPIPEVGQLYRDVWRASSSFGPADQAIAINDVLFYARNVGDRELGNQGRAAYARLLERHAEDPMVRAIQPRLCTHLGWLSHIQGDHSTAMVWFSNAAVASEGEDEDDRHLKTLAWSWAALESIRLSDRTTASVYLANAKQTLVPGTEPAGWYYWVHAETSLALGRIFEAEDWLEEAARVGQLADLKILVPCTHARIEASLGHTAERDRHVAEAEAQITTHTAVYLRQEIEAVRPQLI